MACGEDDLVKKFEEFCSLSGCKDKTQMNSKACGKMAKDCFGKIKGVDVINVVDTNVFPRLSREGKGSIKVNKTNVNNFLDETAIQVIKRKDPKRTTASMADADVVDVKKELCSRLISKGPQVKKTEISSKGNVAGLTDTANYTGASKGRFGKDGEGLGKKGREDIVENDGYVGGYGMKGTFDQKKK